MSKKWKRFLIVIGIILGIITGSIGGYAFYLYHSVVKTTSQMYKPLGKDQSDPLSMSKPKTDRSKAVSTRAKPSSSSKLSSGPALDPNAINILLLGVDKRPGDKGRSDTLMVASLNPDTNSMMLTSIPRDTRVNIAGHSGYSKINAAYAYGNEALSISTVERYLNIPIDYYVEINMQGMASLVNAVGGVTVNNDLDWTSGTFHYKEGILNLNGAEAMGYTRMRHQDPQGDFGRNARQRQVIQAILSKGKSVSTVTKINRILRAVGSNIQTNLTLNDMEKLATNYRQCRQNITNYEVKGTPKYIGGISWVLVTSQEFQHVHDMIINEIKA